MYDLIIVGSGPAGIYAGYLANIHNLKALIVESSTEVGGQMLLFKDKPVYDMPGQVNVDGNNILEKLKEQLKETTTKINLNEKIQKVSGKFPSFILKTNKDEYRTKCIIYATGGGLFEPIKLGFSEEDKFRNIHYSVEDFRKYLNKDIIIFGGGDSAVDWAHFFKDKANSVTLVHRRDRFRASEKLLLELKNKIMILTPYKFCNASYGNEYTTVELTNIKTGEKRNINCNEILVFFGQRKIIEKETNHNLVMHENNFIVNTNMETSEKGIFAIGNVAFYDGKVKMLVTAFGEAATAIGSVVNLVFPGKKMSYYVKKKDN